MALVDVWTHLSANSIVLSKPQMDRLQRYHNELVYWNERVNMVSRKDVEHLWERHIIHALMLLRYVEIEPRARVLDVGTGGGIPGIPLKIARDDVKMTLVDSVAKKVNLVRMFAEHTELKDIDAVCSRVEQLDQDAKYRRRFNVIISRAVAPLTEVVGWTRNLLAPNGTYAILKGGDLSGEIANAQEDHRGLRVVEYQIEAFGMPWFKQDQKKVLVCTVQ